MSLDRLAGRGAAIGAARADAVRGRVAEVVAREVPGAGVEVSGSEVIVTGRGLSTALRWIGSLLR